MRVNTSMARVALSCGVAAFLSALLLGAPAAHAAPFTLGQFDEYGLLVNDGASGGDINTPPVDANIGIGNVTGPINLHNEVVNGQVDCSGSCSTAVAGGNITGTQPVSLGGAPPNGSPASVNSNVAAVSNAIAAAKSLSSTWGAAASSGTAISINTGSQTINASSGNLVNGANVFTTPTFAIGNGHTLTINGSASQYVVIDVTGSSVTKLDGALTLTGGITPDQVLINFLGSGANVQGAANGATLSGTFLIPNEGVQLNSLVINGHLFGGEPGKNFQFVSNAFIHQPPLTTTPLPAAVSLFSAGLGFLGLMFGLRRKRRISAVAA
jgi:hypothetical protein